MALDLSNAQEVIENLTAERNVALYWLTKFREAYLREEWEEGETEDELLGPTFKFIRGIVFTYDCDDYRDEIEKFWKMVEKKHFKLVNKS